MIKKLKKMFIVIALLVFTLILLADYKVLATNSENVFQKVEYTEEFKKWLELSEEEKKDTMMPRMYEIPYTKMEYTNPIYNAKILKASINPKYNLKDVIPENLTIRNQQQTNTCWAFARISSLETNLALSNYKKGINLSKVYDFSERHMEYATSRYFLNNEENPNGYNRTVGSGGTILMADSYLANGYGAVLESEMPFENNENIIDINQIKNKTISSQLYDTVDFPDYQQESGENKTEIMNEIKQHIQNYGSIYAGLHGASASTSDFSCYNESTAGKFCDNIEEHPSDHAISIIGWDDNYSINNFAEDSRPKSNGAWIVRNSWGEKNEIGNVSELRIVIFDKFADECIANGWNSAEEIPNEFVNNIAEQNNWIIENDIVYAKYGDNGLIYVSYEDVNISTEMSGIVKANDSVNYENIYAYDELGMSMVMQMNGSNVMLSNIFDKKTNGTEYLNQISLYAPDAYTCKVYVNPNGTSRTKKDLQLVQLKSGETETFNAGYHTLEFAKPIKINSNSFAVVVEIQSHTNKTIFAMEAKPNISIGNPYANVKIENEKCFVAIGNDLENPKWYDLGKLSQSGLGILLPNGDSTIKAFTTSELMDETLKNIEITTPPTKTSYFEGEDFDKTGMVVKANYNSKTKPSVILDSSSYSITNGTNLKSGQTSVTITYEDKSVEQPITVEKNDIVELKITTPPTKLEYKEGENFDRTGMVVKAISKDGTEREITDYTIENGNNLKVNQTEVTICYGEKTVNQAITVTPNPLTQINITKAPNKTKYVVGQNFDKTGMVVTGTYQDGLTQEITDYTIENGTNLKVGQTSVTIKYEDKSVDQSITVEEKAITGISISKKPSKTKYIQNKEELDLTGGLLKISYNDNSSEEIDLTSEEVKATGFDNKELGKNTITITYQSKTTTFDVEIVAQETPKNSNFDKANCDINSVKYYTFTDKDTKEYFVIDMTVNGIVKNTNNDSYEYYYYLSPNQDETNIQDWVKITENQTSKDKLQFKINTKDIKNYAEVSDSNTVYLYIKEVAIKGGNQSVAISKSMKMDTDVEVEIYLDNVKVDNVDSDNNGNTDTPNKTPPSRLPNAGLRTVMILVLIVSAVSIVVYIRYKNLSKYIK